tara:strand:+ start:193 stop:477 length:285 start_codon:yes stop_codon:yes gene_type:complete
MKDTVTVWKFRNEMVEHGFSVQGSLALFDYLEHLEEDCGIELEYDPVAFRCDYNEYENFEELKRDYAVEDLNELEDNTTVIQIPDSEGLIIHAY